MKKHIRTVHEGKKFFKRDNCEHCSAVKSDMDRHFASVHSKLKPSKCDICDCWSSLKRNITNHVSTVDIRKMEYKCEMCGVIYNNSHVCNIVLFTEIHGGHKE